MSPLPPLPRLKLGGATLQLETTKAPAAAALRSTPPPPRRVAVLSSTTMASTPIKKRKQESIHTITDTPRRSERVRQQTAITKPAHPQAEARVAQKRQIDHDTGLNTQRVKRARQIGGRPSRQEQTANSNLVRRAEPPSDKARDDARDDVLGTLANM